MATLDSAQIAELAELCDVIGRFNEQISKEGPIIDRIYEYRSEYMQLDRKAQIERIRTRLSKHEAPTKAELALNELDGKMQQLEDALKKIAGFRTERETHLAKLREILKIAAVEISLAPEDDRRITEIDAEIARLSESGQIMKDASSMLKRASHAMAAASAHLSSARRAADADKFVGGIIGYALAVKKNSDLGKAQGQMFPAQNLIRKANKMLRSINLKPARAEGAKVPQISFFMDAYFDRYWVDAEIADRISNAEFNSQLTSRRVAHQAAELSKMAGTLEIEIGRLEREASEIDVKTEHEAAKRLLPR